MKMQNNETDAVTKDRPYLPSEIDFDTLDKVPSEYKDHLIRLMAIQAYSELKAATEPVKWIEKAPNFRVRKVFTKVLAEEASHSYLIYAILERLGVSESEAVEIAEGRRGKKMHQASLEGPLSVGHPDNEWIDIMLNHMFLDRAGKFMVSNFTEASFKPWADANKIILAEETAHIGLGFVEMREWLKGQSDDDAARSKISSWYARGLNFFGPPSKGKSESLKKLGLKRRDNEQLRIEFREEVQAVFADLGRPDLIRLKNDSFPYA